jgi:serine/threonine protein kinase
MAPEAFINTKMGKKNSSTSLDMWAIGIMLACIFDDKYTWANLYPESDFINGTFNEPFLNHLKKPVFASISNCMEKKGCSKDTIQEMLLIIDKCLQFNPKNRLNAKEAEEQLKLLHSKL